MECPNCKLTNPDSAQRCDCGYDFVSGFLKQPYLQKTEDEIKEEARSKSIDEYTRVVFLLAGILGALVILGYQIYTYLKTGAWLPISLVTVITWLGIEWAINPQSWFGMHKVLDFIPLSLSIFAFGTGIALLPDE